MSRTGLINTVKTKIDEISSYDSLIVDVGLEDNNPIDTVIDELLDECAKEVLLRAPIYRLTPTPSNASAIADLSKIYTGTIPLPADFVRIAELKMTEWERPVTELQQQGSEIAKRQHNRWLRAKSSKPVAILSSRVQSSVSPPTYTTYPVIEYYSVKTNHTISHFTYIKKEVAENIPEWLQDALCWICASKILGIYGKANESKQALENAVGLLIN